MRYETDGSQKFTFEEITQVVARYRASGLKLPEFARQQGLSASRLHYWVYAKARARSAKAPRPSPARMAFQEIGLAGGIAGSGGWAAEVALPRGVAIRFSVVAAPDWIASVVQALQRPC